jgi:hypothetical protein
MQVHLNDEPDRIRWRWTAHGHYSSKSAYDIQFMGTYCSFNNKAIWRAKAEEKHRLFAWLLIQNKILTADLLQLRNWPCDPICRLCDQEPETAQHISLHCVYAQEVWHLVSCWTHSLVQVPSRTIRLEGWWNAAVSNKPKDEARLTAALVIYTAWNLWKERNRRVFEGVSESPTRLLARIKEEVQVRRLACGEEGELFTS